MDFFTLGKDYEKVPTQLRKTDEMQKRVRVLFGYRKPHLTVKKIF